MNWIKTLFLKETKPFQVGNVMFSRLGVVAIVDSRECKGFSRDDFLKKVAQEAYESGLSKEKKPSHVRYWYDGPMGNQAFESGISKKIKNTVVGFSRVPAGALGANDIAVKLAEDLIQNGNMVLLLLEFNRSVNDEDNDYEIDFYRSLFPDALQITLKEDDI